MCLGDVGQVVSVRGQHAQVRVGVRAVDVSLLTLDEPVRSGDWVLVHSGFALAKVGARDAAAALALRATASPVQEGFR